MRQMRTYDDPGDIPGPYSGATMSSVDRTSPVWRAASTMRFPLEKRELDFGSPTFVRDMKLAEEEAKEREQRELRETQLAKLPDCSTSPRRRARQRSKSAPAKREPVAPRFTQAPRFNPKDTNSFLKVTADETIAEETP